jgi:thioredoxin 1
MNFIPYLFGFLAIALIIWQFYPLIKLRSARGKHAPSLDLLLNDSQRESPKLLLYFMSPKCGMCREITPIVDSLALQYSNILRVNLFEHTEVARELGVMATPAFVLITNGVVEKVKLGGLTESQVLEMAGVKSA